MSRQPKNVLKFHEVAKATTSGITHIAHRIAVDGVTRRNSQVVGEAMRTALSVALDQLKEPGERFMIKGVGTFSIRLRKARRNYNPTTKQMEMLPERKQLVFTRSRA